MRYEVEYIRDAREGKRAQLKAREILNQHGIGRVRLRPMRLSPLVWNREEMSA